MRKSRLVKGWAVVMIVLLCTGAFAPLAGGANSAGVAVNITQMPFNQFVTELVKQNSGKKLLLLENVSTPVDIVAPDATPIEKILASASASVGLDFWQDEDTYYIGHKSKLPDPQKVDDSATGATIDNPASLPAIAQVPTGVNPGTANSVAKPKSVIQKIELQHTSAREMAWMLGATGAISPNAPRQRQLKSRIEMVLDPRRPRINAPTDGADYSSSMLNASSPWLSGALSRNTSATDSYQIFNPGGGYNPGTGTQPTQPGYPIPGGVVNPGTILPGTNTTNTNINGNQDGAGLLQSFIPDGIDDIVGIESLNTLLIRAKNQEAIDQLAGFIKMLDQPTKQALIEVMFVRMSVQDATTLSTSWTITSSPWSVVNQGGSDGTFSVQYVQGNIKGLLSSMIAQTKAKVVNAPRIICQNGSSGAYISLSESIPFVTTSQTEDVYGKVTSVPQISMQTFTQGLEVEEILIHPDNSVTLHVIPTIEDPTDSIAIPGVDNSGSVSGSQTKEIDTRVRVKNGETIMMGGFISNNESQGTSKVPLLGDLPILGPLFFRNINNSANNSETMIFITPTVLEDDPTSFEGMTSLPPLF